MTAKKILTFDPRSLPEDGITLEGEIALRSLDIPETDRISLPHSLRFHIRITPVHGGVLAQGRGTTILRCRCDRCLQYFDSKLAVDDICHFFETTDTESINLTDDIRQDILLSFPQRVHCREDCLGLCSKCGRNLNVRDCGCQSENEKIGSAWDALDNLELSSEDQNG